MQTLEQKQLEFLDNTVAHFNSTNRAVRTGTTSCTYSARLNSDGTVRSTGCAIGRHLDAELARQLDAEELVAVRQSHIFNQLPKWLQDLGQYFLQDVQSLHDWENYWNETGLNAEGKVQYNVLVRKYKLKDLAVQ